MEVLESVWGTTACLHVSFNAALGTGRIGKRSMYKGWKFHSSTHSTLPYMSTALVDAMPGLLICLHPSPNQIQWSPIDAAQDGVHLVLMAQASSACTQPTSGTNPQVLSAAEVLPTHLSPLVEASVDGIKKQI